MAVLLLFCTAGITAGADTVGTSYAETLHMLTDTDTSRAADTFEKSTRNNGRIWTDKTVSADQTAIYDANGNAVRIIESNPDEFLVKLSALSQSYTVETQITPTDTVFVIDISSSMFTNKWDADDFAAMGKTAAEIEELLEHYDIWKDGSVSRLESMVCALNEGINVLMEENPANRFAVVAFGGSSGESRIVPILNLGHHTVSDGVYFSMKSAAYIRANSQLPDTAFLTSPPNRDIKSMGATPTQHGVYAGAQVLLEAAKSIPQGTRKPNIVLLSDGGASLGWEDYRFADPGSNGPDGFTSGNADQTDLGIDVLTVLTAAYCKQQVHDAYYGAADTIRTANFYTIGLGMDIESGDDAKAILNPAAYAEEITRSFSGSVYNMKAVLEDFVTRPAGTAIEFPSLAKNGGSTRELNTVFNDNHYVTDYNYTDGYYEANEPGTVTEAFRSIAQKITSAGQYTTDVDATTGSDEYGGYLIFSDVLGEYMEVRDIEGLWYNNELHEGINFSREISQNTSGQLYDRLIAALVAHHPPGVLDEAGARALVESCKAAGKAGGGIYWNSDSDYSNKITYYANSERAFVGQYFDGGGTPYPAVPAGATAKVELYTFTGTAVNPITGDVEPIVNMMVRVVTALEEGKFEGHYSDGETLVHKLSEGQQLVRWYLPASLLPQRVVKPRWDGAVVKGVTVSEAVPARLIYSVGLNEELLAEKFAGDDYKNDSSREGGTEGAYYFYTSDFGGSSVNTPVSYFEPSDANPYYYYTEDDENDEGYIRLYTAQNDTALATTYNSDTTYYTRHEYYDENVPGYSTVQWLPVGAVTSVVTDGPFPYIEPGQIKAKSNWVAKGSAVFEDDDNVYPDYASSAQPVFLNNNIKLEMQFLGNNGRLEMPLTSVEVKKEWDAVLNLDVTNEADSVIKNEWVQLYGDNTPIGDPLELTPLSKPTDVTDPTDQSKILSAQPHEWSGLPLYKPGSNGNAERIVYTVAEGEWDSSAGVFTPYDNSNIAVPGFNVDLYQPTWDSATGTWSPALIHNRSLNDYEWIFIISKEVEGLSEAEKDDLNIPFEFYISLDNGATYKGLPAYDGQPAVPKAEFTYENTQDGGNGEFRDDMYGIFWAISEEEADDIIAAYNTAFGASLATLEPQYLLVEKAHASSIPTGYTWSATAAGGGAEEIDWITELGASVQSELGLNPGDKVFRVVNPGSALDPAALPAPFSNAYYIDLTNSYTPDYPTLTLLKEYELDGASVTPARHDITFVVEGFASEEDRTHKVKRIFYDTTSSGDIEDAGQIEFPLSGNHDGLSHPDHLPQGYYRITEYGAEDIDMQADDAHSYVVSLTASGNITATADDNTVEFYLGNGIDASLTLTNEYTQRNMLTLRKLVTSMPEVNLIRAPDDIVFTVTGPGYYREVGHGDFGDDPQGNSNGNAFVLNDLPDGTYTVTETGGQINGYEVTVKANNETLPIPLETSVTLSASDREAEVNFVNTYSLIPDPPGATLNIVKHIDGIASAPASMVFTVTGLNELDELMYQKTFNYSEFTSDPKTLTITDLKPGAYTISESGASVSGYTYASNHPEGFKIELEYGEAASVVFTNTYTAIPPPPPPPPSPPQTDPDPEPDSPAPVYALSIKKTLAEGQRSMVNPGEEARFAITVLNTGNQALSGVRVTDEIDGVTREIDIIPVLAAGASKTYTYNYTVPAGKMPGTTIRNTAYAEEFHVGKISSYAEIMVSMFIEEHIWYIRGDTENNMRPGDYISRAEAAMVFFRLMKPELKSVTAQIPFSDVKAADWFGEGIGIMAHYNLMNGYEDKTFRPLAPITRRELVMIMSRFDVLAAPAAGTSFKDLSPSDIAYSAILSAVAKGWITGDPDGSFRPDDDITRAEFVTVLNRALHRQIKMEDIPAGRHVFGDFNTAHWAYEAFTEAVYTHEYRRLEDGLNEEWTAVTDDGISAAYNR